MKAINFGDNHEYHTAGHSSDDFALIAALLFLFRPYDYGASMRRFGKIENQSECDPSADTLWRSVKIRPGLGSCKQAVTLSEQLFLSKEAPALPLPLDCFEANCTCHYLFFGDRRSGLDRRVELQKLTGFFPKFNKERRQSPGRRIDDLAPA